jgi:acetyltransferase-like isoleucine patch superfamily enzyme
MQPLYYPPWQWKHYADTVCIYEHCIILKPEMISLASGVRIDAMTRLEGGLGLSIGENVHIGTGSRLNIGGGELEFGAHSGCSVNVVIATANPDLSYQLISAAEAPEDCHVSKRKTVVGKYVVIFAGAILCPGVTIGDYAVIGAGSVVTHDIEPWEIVAGNPAQQIGVRKLILR